MTFTTIITKNIGKIVRNGPTCITTNYLTPIAYKSTYIDTIDSFTNNLVDRKTLKWEINREKLHQKSSNVYPPIAKQFSITAKHFVRQIANLKDVRLEMNFVNMSKDQIDQLFRSAIYDDSRSYVYELIDECRHHSKFPSEAVIHEICLYLITILDLNALQLFTEFCDTNNCSCCVSYYNGLCLWKLGRYQASLELLKCKYCEVSNNKDKATICAIFDIIVRETVNQKSEAVLVALKNVAVSILKQHNDSIILNYLWQNTFQSNWYSDQQLANQLYEDYEDVRKMVSDKGNLLCYNYLHNHNVDAVHRFIELMLKFDLKDKCRICLCLLFEYQYWRKDLRGCSEILRNSLDLNIHLPDEYNRKMIDLLLGHPNPVQVQSPEKSLKKFKLKF